MATQVLSAGSPEENKASAHTFSYVREGLNAPDQASPTDWIVDKMQMAGDITVQPEKKRVGNQEGFRLSDLKREMNELKTQLQNELREEFRAEVSSLQEGNLSLQGRVSTLEIPHRSLRRRVLEDRRIEFRPGLGREDREGAIVSKGNEVAHGGDILGDIAAIQQAEEEKSTHLVEYDMDFLNVYKIPFKEACGKLSPSQPKLIRTFDILASVFELKSWETSDRNEAKRAIEEKAMVIVNAVRAARNSDKMDQLSSRLEEDGDLEETYSAIVGRFDNPVEDKVGKESGS